MKNKIESRKYLGSSDHQPSSLRIIPDEPVTGRSQAKLTTDFWKWSYSIPADQSPFNDTTGEFADVNQSGSVFFLTGALFVPGGADPAEPGTTRDIEVPRGKEIFLPILNVEWDNVQLQAFFGDFFRDLPDNGILTPKELRNLNENNMQTATDMFFKIDGDTLFADADWGDDGLMGYRQVTPTPKGFNYTIPENNVLGLPLEATDNGRGLIKGGMSDGIWINLELDPGYHELSFGGTFNLGSINIDLDGDGIFNEPGKEVAYQDAFKSLGKVEIGVNYNITQL